MRILGPIILTLLCLIGSVTTFAKETFTFDAGTSEPLQLDFYSANTSDASPVVVFAYGGAFMGGQRDDERYVPFFDFLTRNGVAVVSTDYRTLLKGISPSDISSKADVAERLGEAVTAATSDLLKATAFTVAHAAEWNINPAEVFVCGTSSGAIAALQAEMEICNSTKALAGLPADFNYAGVISFAGAVFCYGEPYWRKTPAPMLLFHGNADSNVPYDTATIDSFGLWGSKAIVGELSENGHTCRFHSFIGGNHGVALSPMKENVGEILDFIKAVVAGNCHSSTTREDTDNENFQTEFTVEDYLISNFF